MVWVVDEARDILTLHNLLIKMCVPDTTDYFIHRLRAFDHTELHKYREGYSLKFICSPER